MDPILDVEGVLKFPAMDKALINNDTYWVRTSDYSLCEDPTGNDAPRLCLKGLADQRRAYLLDFT